MREVLSCLIVVLPEHHGIARILKEGNKHAR